MTYQPICSIMCVSVTMEAGHERMVRCSSSSSAYLIPEQDLLAPYVLQQSVEALQVSQCLQFIIKPFCDASVPFLYPDSRICSHDLSLALAWWQSWYGWLAAWKPRLRARCCRYNK